MLIFLFFSKTVKSVIITIGEYMKNKGFTILEILSALIILTFIVVITVPLVLSMIRNAQKVAFNESVVNVMKIIELDRAEVSGNRQSYDFVDGKLYFEAVEIAFKGEFNGDGLIEIDEEGRMALVLSSDDWCAKKTYSQVSSIITDGPCDDITEVPVDDTTKPVITLIGNSSITINQGDSYTDQGAEVTDNVDATRTISGTGTVDINTPGEYTITYNVTDAACADTVTRTVTVLIALIGNSSIAINQGDSYTDQGGGSNATRTISGMHSQCRIYKQQMLQISQSGNKSNYGKCCYYVYR
jgi:type II secretory pathway pseudopilin PulG